MAVALEEPGPIAEVTLSPGQPIDDALLHADTPWIARGLVSDWPATQAGAEGGHEFFAYLQSFSAGRPTSAFIAEPEHEGRLFYNEQFDGFNFVQLDTTLEAVFSKLLKLKEEASAPTLYVGSTPVSTALPGFQAENNLDMASAEPLVSIWLGNRCRVAAHFDYPRNLACCIAGRRRFTAFPPEQVANLYIGPWDLTPAGQPISLVDTQDPDLDRFPRFTTAWAAAQSAELEAGDVIYMPGMWWHQVESLEPINALVNYWWSETPAVYGAPMDDFDHALLALKQLPAGQKRAWKALFDQYVFNEDNDALAHLPEHSKGRLAPLQSDLARRLRADLINRLKR